MTRATAKPLKRIVDGNTLGSLVIEITDRTLTIRPVRVRVATAVVSYPWGALYTHGLIVADTERRKARRQK